MMRRRLALLAPINIAEHAITTTAERAFLEALDGSCRTPIAALARIDGDALNFLGEVLTPDGEHRWRREETVASGRRRHRRGPGAGAEAGRGDPQAEAGPLYTAHFGDNGW